MHLWKPNPSSSLTLKFTLNLHLQFIYTLNLHLQFTFTLNIQLQFTFKIDIYTQFTQIYTMLNTVNDLG